MTDLRAAGPILDALVAERVMGMAIVGDGHCGVCRSLPKQPIFMLEWGAGPCPDYSTSLVEAWEVALRWEGEWMLQRRRGYYVMTFQQADEDYSAEGDTAPLAICRAALITKGIPL